MKVKRLLSLKFQAVVSIVLAALFAFVLTASILLKNQSHLIKLNFTKALGLTADKKALELDSCFTSIENSVINAQNYILRTIDEERILTDPKYEEKYMQALTEELDSLARLTKGAVCAYFRMNFERFGGTRGVIIEGNTKTGFMSVGNTDLQKYSPSDMEHVGWYYIPLWKGEPVWTAPYENKNINMHMISYIIPMYRGDEFLGVVGMDINLATLKDIVNNLPFENTLAVLIGQEKNLVHYNDVHASNKSVEHSSDTRVIFEKFQKDGAILGGVQEFQWGPSPYFGLMKKLENGMSLVIALPERFLTALRNALILKLSIAFLLISLLTFILLYLAYRYLLTPINIIAETTNRLSRGELNIHIPYKSENELGLLVDNIRKMTAQMKEYIDYIREQTKKEREAKEVALTESKSKSEFLASMYLSLHEIDLEHDSFAEIHSRGDIGETIGRVVGNVTEKLPAVMKQLSNESSWDSLIPFVDLNTINERMKQKITIAQEFLGVGGKWCRGRFIAMDKDSYGNLRHVLWAVEYIDEEKKAREQLQKERDKLQIEAEKNFAASQAKSTFLANMSHEIRTPINAVLGMDEMILRECKDTGILEYASNIKTAGTNLLSIVNDILDFSKIEAGKMEILPESYETSTVVGDLLNMISERAEKKGLKLILKADSNLPKTLFGDSIRIKQCILNLLTNAVKYTKEGSVTFTIDYEKLDEKRILLKVSVEDTGSGIKPEDMEKLFTPFERIEEGRNRTIEGTGLGMSIVMRTLSMMDSKLEVQSEYGKGSVFSFKLEQIVVDWEKVGDIRESYKNSTSRFVAYSEKFHAPKAKLLFVDDTEMNLEVIKGLLKNTKITIHTALSGKEALEMVQKESYDILFIDHRMPEMDGIETFHAMQKMESNLSAGKPCIVLTANALSGVKKMYLDEGFTDYLSKPVNPEKLEDMIRLYLPPEYIEIVSEDDSSNAEVGSGSNDAENQFVQKYRTIEEIDVETALANCGSAEVLESTVQRYHACIDEKANELQKFYEEGDWKNYCIKVHALKSTSRLIGAMELSKMAAELESLSDKKQVEQIHEKHQPLIDLYLSYRQKLLEVVPIEDLPEAEKAEITEEECSEKLKQIADFAASFDIDGLDDLMAQLSKVSIPQTFAEKFDKIRTAVENVDFIEVSRLAAE
ncbi:ATP-binding protein [uncultured Treponema sp.]|uniref:ATP-binding protein n=1 Tax=uncultured Treponema sp. TaxID=162155 RepID=UPI0025FB9C32|nr:ATP-binding protein [uncultured Treponema sp.]